VLAIGAAGERKSLVCTYWGGDAGRTFEVIVNGVTVATQTLRAERPGERLEVIYPLPDAALAGQQNVTIRLRGVGRGRVGGVLGVRLVHDRQPK